MDQPWINFWKLSAEHANEALRLNKISRDGKLCTDNNEVDIKDLVFKATYEYYLKHLIEMDVLMDERTTPHQMALYRNVFNDIYHELEDGDQFMNNCFTSCFTDDYNPEYGDFSIKVIVEKGTPYLQYDDVIILPPGLFELIERNEIGYVIRFVQRQSLFQRS